MHAIVQLFDDYWNNLKGDKKLPDFLDFKIQDVPEDVIPYLSLLQVEEKPRRFRYSVAGTSVVASYGEDLSGKYFDDLDLGGKLEVFLKDFDKAVDDGIVARRIDRYEKQDGHIYSFDGHVYPFMGIEGRVSRMIILSLDERDPSV